jgi:peptidoglycan/LPS O-acetylase OafA/YrhL
VSLEVLWSISVEEQFYLMFPLALALNRRAKWPAVLPVAIGLVIAWTSRAWLARTTPTVIYRSTFANGDHLLLGALLAQVGRSSSDIWRAFARTGLAGETGALASVLLVAAIVPTTPLVWFLFVLASSLSTTALVGVLVHGERWLGRLLSVGYVRRLGQMTYAGYVFHEYPLGVAAFCLAKLTSNKLIAAPVRTAVALPLVFAVAYLARVLIEQRAAKIRERLAV